MKKRLTFLWVIGIVSIACALFTGCGSKAQEVKFEATDLDTAAFHEIKVAEKVKDGVVFYKGDQVVYETKQEIQEAIGIGSYKKTGSNQWIR
ncbi:MAG: hypothetical protein HFE73_00515 [Firmicutes bacterium]|jgi:hypothetical protein|nr:hypothetical protein [Bacillota bacterium]